MQPQLDANPHVWLLIVPPVKSGLTNIVVHAILGIILIWEELNVLNVQSPIVLHVQFLPVYHVKVDINLRLMVNHVHKLIVNKDSYTMDTDVSAQLVLFTLLLHVNLVSKLIVVNATLFNAFHVKMGTIYRTIPVQLARPIAEHAYLLLSVLYVWMDMFMTPYQHFASMSLNKQEINIMLATQL